MSKRNPTGQRPNGFDLRALRRGFAAGRDAGSPPPEQMAAFARLADDLNQALCAITANADAIVRLIDRNPPDPDEIRAAAGDIATDAQRASRAIHLAQRMAGVPMAVDIDVSQLVDQCVHRLRGEMLARRVVCDVENAAQLPGVRGFRDQLLQLFTSLVKLALDRVSASQPERRLRVRTTRHDSRAVAISIEEAGYDIRPEGAPRLLDPFCDRIVRAHGGHISMTRAADGGAAFQVILPASS